MHDGEACTESSAIPKAQMAQFMTSSLLNSISFNVRAWQFINGKTH